MQLNNFLDAHIHIWEFSLFNYFTNLQKASTLAEVSAMLQANPIQGWLVGVRFNQEKINEKNIPDREFMDKVFGDRPAIIIRTCLHLVIMNTKAMEELDYYSANGIFQEADVFLIMNTLARHLKLAPGQIIKQGLSELNRLGITRVIDMSMSPFILNLFHEVDLTNNGLVKIDFYTTNLKLLNTALGYKVFLDGGLGVRTAALTEDYSDQPGNNGTLNHQDAHILEVVKNVHQQGKPVAFHAIGDRAVDQFLRLCQHTRHHLDRLEHVQYARPEQLDRIAELEIPICIQPAFSREIPWASQRLGPKRMETAYAWDLMLSKGIRLLAGSDAPVDEVDPIITAFEVDGLKGNQHLSYSNAIEIYTDGNWKFYGWQK